MYVCSDGCVVYRARGVQHKRGNEIDTHTIGSKNWASPPPTPALLRHIIVI